ncbi:F-box/LRR-repeat protein 12-like [Papaver somniferum]|uniref:F-box/LRR-repeat protein 12-like n=1 Tax=Papaver somniferum TaxID=3469 RepID=UPI000E704F32|nr:F-box/LRR-repeat protein 12-like [Papaver somniferum]
MSLSHYDKYKRRSDKLPTSKTLQEEETTNNHDDNRPCKIRKTSSSITNLSGDCLNLIFKCLETIYDRNSFGLTCHKWFDIQNNNQESLWYHTSIYARGLSPEIMCKLLIRFQHLKYLSLRGLPRITDFVTSKSQSFGSNVQTLMLDFCSQYSDMQLSLLFSWFPSLTCIRLDYSNIADKGLETLANCCPSLEEVSLQCCYTITDSGIGFLVQKCRQLRSLDIRYCSSITGISFLGCAQTLTYLVACGCKINPEGINAIVSGGGLEYLCLLTYKEDLAKVGEGCIINTEAVVTISKSCPLLTRLLLSNCEEVELEGWEAIGLNCKQLKSLFVMGCQKFCDVGLQAICDGCSNLSELYVDGEKNNISSSALELFECKKPDVLFLQ